MHPLLLGISLIISVGSTAHADVAFSNLGPGDSFDASSSYWLTGPGTIVDGFEVGNSDFAAPFAVDHPQDFILSTAELPLTYIDGANSLTLRLLSDDGGLPGSELVSVQISGIPASATLLTADFNPTPVTLSAGHMYWLMGDAEQDTSVVWSLNNIGYLGLAFNSGGGWVVAIEDHPSPALRISGTIVPEPTSWLLAVSAVLALIGMSGSANAALGFPLEPQADTNFVLHPAQLDVLAALPLSGRTRSHDVLRPVRALPPTTTRSVAAMAMPNSLAAIC